MGNKDKNIRLTFYVVCGLLLGAPYIWKIIKLIPELLKTLPNAAEILASTGYTVLIIASLVVAFKLCEPLWLRIVGIYSTVGLIVCLLSMLTQALGANDVFAVLFEIVCAPFYGVDSPLAAAAVFQHGRRAGRDVPHLGACEGLEWAAVPEPPRDHSARHDRAYRAS